MQASEGECAPKNVPPVPEGIRQLVLQRQRPWRHPKQPKARALREVDNGGVRWHPSGMSKEKAAKAKHKVISKA